MSEWIEVKKEDLSFDDNDINILFERDSFGNRYIEIPRKILIEFLKENNLLDNNS